MMWLMAFRYKLTSTSWGSLYPSRFIEARRPSLRGSSFAKLLQRLRRK